MKAIKHIAVAIAALGFLVTLGTAGSSDLNLIGIESATGRCFIGMGMMVGGMLTANYVVEKENTK